MDEYDGEGDLGRDGGDSQGDIIDNDDADIDNEDLDGIPLDGAALLKGALSNQTQEDIDGIPSMFHFNIS